MLESTNKGHLPEDLIPLKDAARLANDVHPKTIRRWIDRELLKAYRRGHGRALFVSRSEVVALMQPVEVGGAA